MNKTDIRICGMGGQGVIMSAMVVGKAASINEDRWSTMVQSFGPEARGSTCSAQLMISDEVIGFPYIKKSDVFVVFSQAGYEKYVDEISDNGTIVYESDLVTLDDRLPKSVKRCGISGGRIAREDIGKMIVFNMVMVGFLVASTEIVSFDAMADAIRQSVPPGTEELNMKAFKLGYEFKS